MRTVSFVAVGLSLVAWTTGSWAQDKEACLDAASKAQKLRSSHWLVEAREQLRICASSTCPTAVQSDCTGWLAEVERSLPTVVVGAKSPGGADRFDVQVTVDGTPLPSKFAGQAVPMNPGAHAFHFQAADGSVVDQQVLVREGEKNQEVSVVIGSAPPPAQPAPAPSAPSTTTSTTTAPADQGPAGGSSPWKTVGWVAGGVGVAGLGVGAVFGIVAMNDKSSAHCNGDVCAPGSTGGIRSAALVSDVGWIAGGLLLASGAALVLFAPAPHPDGGAGVRIAPSMTAHGGGAMIEGAW